MEKDKQFDLIKDAVDEAKAFEKKQSRRYIIFVILSILLGLGWLTYSIRSINEKERLISNLEEKEKENAELAQSQDSLLLIIQAIERDTTITAEDKKSKILGEIEKIKPEEPESSNWAIVIGADESFAGANWEVSQAADLGYTEGNVYYRKGRYRSVLFFEGKAEAYNKLSLVKKEINGSSYPVDLSKWCPDKEWSEGKKYFICK